MNNLNGLILQKFVDSFFLLTFLVAGVHLALHFKCCTLILGISNFYFVYIYTYKYIRYIHTLLYLFISSLNHCSQYFSFSSLYMSSISSLEHIFKNIWELNSFGVNPKSALHQREYSISWFVFPVHGLWLLFLCISLQNFCSNNMWKFWSQWISSQELMIVVFWIQFCWVCIFGSVCSLLKFLLGELEVNSSEMSLNVWNQYVSQSLLWGSMCVRNTFNTQPGSLHFCFGLHLLFSHSLKVNQKEPPKFFLIW